jgi:hypothetical protein
MVCKTWSMKMKKQGKKQNLKSKDRTQLLIYKDRKTTQFYLQTKNSIDNSLTYQTKWVPLNINNNINYINQLIQY